MNPIGLTLPNSLAMHTAQGSSRGGGTFGQLLNQAVSQLENSQNQANQAITGAMTGQITVTQAMVSMSEAQSTLDVATSIRNNVVQAYQSIMNMPVG